MKISYLHIRNYKQFSDLELDLTYPKGHKKAGQPLDKICIIGQSGTGKTNLLDVIKKSTIDFSGQPKNDYLPFLAFIGKETDDRYIITKFRTQKKFNAETLFTDDASKITFEKDSMLENEKNYFVSTVKNTNLYEKIVDEEFEFDESKMSHSDKKLYGTLVSAKSELVLESINENKMNPALKELERSLYGAYATSLQGRKKTVQEKEREINRAINDIEEKYTSVSKSLKQLKRNNFLDKYIINVNDEAESLWIVMREKIDNYQDELSKYIGVLSNKLVSDDNYEKENYKNELKIWEQENENLLEKIAEDINFILKKFNLELTKIDENQQSYNGLTIKDLSNDTVIKYDDLSTGTKNLLSTLIPLKTYAPKDSIILIDEPEMSFYPDIQRQLTDLYTKVGTNNQLILATHSPLIASSFEPWEVVELKFDKNNQIYREKYYEGENHVDNYTIDPRMLTWTSILTDVFDLREDSNFTEREKGLMEYVSLKTEIKGIQNKNSKDAKEKIKRFKKLSQLLGLQN